MSGWGERFRDAVAFTRSVVREDWDAAHVILASNPNPLDIMVPQSWILAGCINKLSDTMEVPVDEVWRVVLESIEIAHGDDKDE